MIDYRELQRRREIVEWFTNPKLSKLLEHINKGTWEEIPVIKLLDLMLDEIEELKEAINLGNHTGIIRECADVSNYAMFIADRYNNCKT